MSVDNIPRLLAAGGRLLVSLRSVKLLCFGLEILDFLEANSKYISHVLRTNFVSVKCCDNFNFVCYLC